MRIIRWMREYYGSLLRENPMRPREDIPNRKKVIWTYIVYPITLLLSVFVVLYIYRTGDFSKSYIPLLLIIFYYVAGKFYGIYK